jgi:Protein of unknown function (DUF2917)
MKPSHALGKSRGARINLGANEVITVPGRRSTSICCVHGQVWVTREGDLRDYIVPRGLRFVAPGAGRIVVNGTADHSTVEVGSVKVTGASTSVHSALQVDWQCFAQIESEARRARTAYFATILSALGRCAWRRVVGWLADAMTALRRRKAPKPRRSR